MTLARWDEARRGRTARGRRPRAAGAPALRALAGAALAVVLGACGAPRYMPLAVVSPAPLDDTTARIGPLHLRVRIGREWVEIRARNAGDAAVAIDADGIELVEEGGPTHRLVEASRVYALQYAGGVVAPGGDAPAGVARSAGRRGVDFGSDVSALAAAHRRPLVDAPQSQPAGRAPAERRVLRPGETLELILFAAEHVIVRPDGSIVVGPFLGERSAGAATWVARREAPTLPGAEADAHWVQLAVPVWTASAWHRAVVVARLPPRSRPR